MINKEYSLTDEQSLGHKSKMADINESLNSYFGPEEWERLRSMMVLENALIAADKDTMPKVYCYRKPAEPIRKRVPRAWWGWRVITFRKIKSSLKRLRLWVWVFLIGLVVVGVCGHSIYLWLIGL